MLVSSLLPYCFFFFFFFEKNYYLIAKSLKASSITILIFSAKKHYSSNARRVMLHWNFTAKACCFIDFYCQTHKTALTTGTNCFSSMGFNVDHSKLIRLSFCHVLSWFANITNSKPNTHLRLGGTKPLLVGPNPLYNPCPLSLLVTPWKFYLHHLFRPPNRAVLPIRSTSYY